jgi:uncharacterized protein DUF4365
MIDTNALGDRGEAIFRLAVTTLHGRQPLFRPATLGEKWPIADFAIELVNQPGRFFLVQVKATQESIRPRAQRLPIDVKADRVGLLLSSPMPAYLVAVHEPSEQAFLAAPRSARRIRDVTTAFSLNDGKVRLDLRQEVEKFWSSVTSPFSSVKSIFVDP